MGLLPSRGSDTPTMTLAEAIKSAVLRIAAATGVFKLVLNSEWRRQRLVILCYHGVSTDDEHLCFPGFYMHPRLFESRLEHLRKRDIRVLPLDEALDRLEAGTLPPRSAAIGIDDGFYGMYAAGRPILRRFGFPTTVYMTTYYVHYNVPVFDPMAEYLLWKANGRTISWREIFPEPIFLDDQGRPQAAAMVRNYAILHKLSGPAKNDLLRELAGHLGVDYQDLCARRMLYLVNAPELREWAKEAEFQLHSHRHRLSRDRQTFRRQLSENEAVLQALTGRKCRHFCYPGGMYLPEFPQWLREYGIRSAVHCGGGLAAPGMDHLLLPRVMDTSNLPLEQFDSWITGASALIPRRQSVFHPDQLTQVLEDEGEVLQRCYQATAGS